MIFLTNSNQQYNYSIVWRVKRKEKETGSDFLYFLKERKQKKCLKRRGFQLRDGSAIPMSGSRLPGWLKNRGGEILLILNLREII